jgi:predicted AlkP superfamily phosphohydrolase/phosphomutase
LIWVNRELPETERQNCMHAIVSGLLKLCDPETGEPSIAAVRRTSEIYGAEINRSSPDLIVIPARNYSISPGFPHDSVVKEVTSGHIGTHSMEGICVFDGPEIMPNVSVRARLVDMAPTLIYQLGEPVPSYMQGRVLAEIFKENVWRDEPVEHVEDEGEPEGRLRGGYSEDERVVIEKRLQDLGYL